MVKFTDSEYSIFSLYLISIQTVYFGDSLRVVQIIIEIWLCNVIVTLKRLYEMRNDISFSELLISRFELSFNREGILWFFSLPAFTFLHCQNSAGNLDSLSQQFSVSACSHFQSVRLDYTQLIEMFNLKLKCKLEKEYFPHFYTK